MALFDLHSPWAFTFGILGSIISLFVYFAPLPTFIRIYKEKSTLKFQSLPYAVALFSSMLWLYYAYIKTNTFMLITINSVGCVIESIYIIIFLIYAPRRAMVGTLKLFSSLNLGSFLVIFLTTSYVPMDVSTRVAVVGWVCVAFSVAVFAAPLSIVFQVVRTKSVEFMPITLSACLTLSAVTWLGYGVSKQDLCIALPNVLGLVLGALQMLLYMMYKNRVKQKVVEEEKLSEKCVIIVVNLGTSEVHPVDEESPRSCSIVKAIENDKFEEEEEEEEEDKDKGLIETHMDEVLGGDEEGEIRRDCKLNLKIEPSMSIIVCAA